jgi:hypothetical protein
MTNILVNNYRYSSSSIIMVRNDPSLQLFNFSCYELKLTVCVTLSRVSYLEFRTMKIRIRRGGSKGKDIQDLILNIISSSALHWLRIRKGKIFFWCFF